MEQEESSAEDGANSRERILNTAEKLFSEKGISGTSLRALTRAADVNLASVHYYFGSKEALLDAVIDRRAGPINAQRLVALEALTTAGGNVEIEAILEAFLFPPLDAISGSTEEKQRLGRLTARIEAQPPDLIETLSRKHFAEVSTAFVEALQNALPHLRKELVADRFRYAVCLFSFLFSGNFDLDTIPNYPPQPRGMDQNLSDIIGFIAAGMRSADPIEARQSRGKSGRGATA